MYVDTLIVIKIGQKYQVLHLQQYEHLCTGLCNGGRMLSVNYNPRPKNGWSKHVAFRKTSTYKKKHRPLRDEYRNDDNSFLREKYKNASRLVATNTRSKAEPERPDKYLPT